MLLATGVNATEGRNYGQTVSECNRQANARNVKGPARKAFVDQCTARAMGGPGQTGRYPGCSERADERRLTGDPRREFIERCADLRVEEHNADFGDSLRESQPYCTARADQRRLAGDPRVRFIDRCLERDRGLSDQLWNRHQQCHERARERGLTSDLRREFVVACLDGYRAYNIASHHLTTDAGIR